MKVEAITVIVQIDGKVCLLPIDRDVGELFVGMVSVCQTGSPKKTKAIALTPPLVEKAREFGALLDQEVARVRAEVGKI